MAVTGTETNQDLCTAALRKIGVVALDVAATADEIDIAKDQLNRMLKSWQALGYNVFTKASQSVTLTTAASYTLSPVRPLEILSCRFKQSGRETPMVEMTRDEYDRLPIKTTTGTPTQFYYDRQRESALLYIWPVLSSASGETLEITYTREIEDVVLGNAADVPAEWYDAVVYNLADRLQDDFDTNNNRVTARAAALLAEVQAWDRDGSVWFAGYQ